MAPNFFCSNCFEKHTQRERERTEREKKILGRFLICIDFCVVWLMNNFQTHPRMVRKSRWYISKYYYLLSSSVSTYTAYCTINNFVYSIKLRRIKAQVLIFWRMKLNGHYLHNTREIDYLYFFRLFHKQLARAVNIA